MTGDGVADPTTTLAEHRLSTRPSIIVSDGKRWHCLCTKTFRTAEEHAAHVIDMLRDDGIRLATVEDDLKVDDFSLLQGELEAAVKILEFGLYLCMYGTDAPGQEDLSWDVYARDAENFLRRNEESPLGKD